MDNIQVVEKALEAPRTTKFPVKPKPTAEQARHNFYLDFINAKMEKEDKAWLEKDIMNKLHTIPMPDKDVGSYQAPKINSMHQADVLWLPSDNKRNRCLCVSDIHTRLFDCEAMIGESAEKCIKALTAIYKRNILNFPKELVVDAGTSFKGAFKTWCDAKHIFLKPILAGKHLGQIDSKIKILGNALLRRQYAIEHLTKEPNRKWLKDIRTVVGLINDYTMTVYHPQSGLEEDKLDIKVSQPITILEIGTKVRLQLFIPMAGADYTMDKTRFRSGDLRWKNKISKITNIVIRPNSPIYYSIDGNDSKLFLRNQLQVVLDDERGPPVSLLTTQAEKKAYAKTQAPRV
jgi:hypothetical protein